MKELQISDFKDGITRVQFAPETDDTLVASSWDATVRVFVGCASDDAARLKTEFSHGGPVLDVCFAGSCERVVSGSLDRSVAACDVSTGATWQVGEHSDAVKAVLFCSFAQTIASGGWDARLKLWDVRNPHGLCADVVLPGKVIAMGATGGSSANTIVVTTTDHRVVGFDTRAPTLPLFDRESPLKQQIRTVTCMPDGRGFILGSVDGRVAVEYFIGMEDDVHRPYAFKCHRVKNGAEEVPFPVNAIEFHPVHGTFATGGSDGMINVWDGEHRKRLCQFHKYPSSVSSLSFNRSGSRLAIASSYLFEDGEKEHPADQLFVRHIVDADVVPKKS